jgi:hypothetical protein
MALIDPVKRLCRKLNLNAGWKALMAKHGLDLGAGNLAKALNDRLAIDRSLIGFGDFAIDGIRAIEPGSPSRSLLFHALASPNVLQQPSGVPLDLFPTPLELDDLENYIFGVQKLKLTDVIAKFPGKPFAVVVFACEYRPAPETTHRQHADMVYSRTGNARVGNRPARYVPEFRGFHPEVPAEPFGIAVSPARYAAYLAVQLSGNDPKVHRMGTVRGDATRKFWVPVHKLFPGSECLDHLDLTVSLQASHVNEKIFRAQELLGNRNPPDAPPYRIRKGIAELSTDPDLGPGWVVPAVHPHLVEEAKDAAGKDVTFAVPKKPGNWATVDLWSIFRTQSAPEYVHARTEVLADGTRRDLNQFNAPSASFPQDLPVDERVQKGGYNALHYADFTGDGFVDATCSLVQGVSDVSPKSMPAYTIVAAPDFFPSTGQRELVDWVNSNAIPDKVRFQVWGQNRPDLIPPRRGQPESLNNQRFPANLRMPGSPFLETDNTITAIVGLPLASSTSPTPTSDLLRRLSHLPDDGAGVFAPGWEVSKDTLNGTDHLAAYGLGSPFPEDSKLCAALSSFWPAVAPDVTRTMDTAQHANLSGTVIPMTDAEIGQIGGLPWDGVPGPVEIVVGAVAFAEYNSFVHADYVRNALSDKFSLRLTSKVDFKAYSDRILGMLCGYLALGVERTSAETNPALSNLPEERNQWIVLSFSDFPIGGPELTQATIDTGVSPNAPCFRATVFRATDNSGNSIPFTTPANFQKRRIPITGRVELILAPTDKKVFLKNPNELKWRLGVVEFE